MRWSMQDGHAAGHGDRVYDARLMLRRYGIGIGFGLLTAWLFAAALGALGLAIAGDGADFASRAAWAVVGGGAILGILVARWAIVLPTPNDGKVMLGVALLTSVIVVAAALQPTTVQDYCSYGAVSDFQLAGCVTHVPRSYVESLNTDAARYGRADMGSCLADAGPYCSPRFFVYQWLGW